MRPGALAVVALVCAVLGATSVLVVGKAAGLLDENKTETIFVPAEAPDLALDVAATPAARPLIGNRFQPARIYAARSAGVVTVYAYYDSRESASQGSGFVVSPKGYVLTSAHVITTAGNGTSGKAADRVFVGFKDGDRVPAKVIGWDVFDDVGLLQVEPGAHSLAPVPLGDSSKVVVGEPVAAMGSPFGNEDSLAVGVVSATRRSIASLTSDYLVTDAIQTDAPITHGNSGGPLFDARGRVIGINAQIRSNSGEAEGVGFAMPINAARRSMEQLVANGRVVYAYVGVTTEDLTPTLARHLNLRVQRGAMIGRVEDETPADDAGLRGGDREELFNGQRIRRGGDVIVAIDGAAVRRADDVVRIVAERLAPGQVSSFTVVRDGERRVFRVRLGTRPEDASSGR
jgi:S1-C subfamily serine protease